MIERIEIKEWMALNAKLQTKKSKVRKALKERGILSKSGYNEFDHYNYFSEAQYKQLFTELFSENGLELKFTELEYQTFEGTEKQPNGRLPKLEFSLIDVETGFYETSAVTGEGIDKGDKGGYKAYTGALKYYLANTFMVATGDDPEKESPSTKMNTVKPRNYGDRKASAKQVEVLARMYTGDNLTKLLTKNGVSSLDELPMDKASDLISRMKERSK